MTKQELRSLIREEITRILSEAKAETFTFSGVKAFMSFTAIPVFKKHGIDVTKIKKSYDPDSGTTEITVSMDAKTAEKIGRELEKLDKVGESFGGYIQEGKTRTLKEAFVQETMTIGDILANGKRAAHGDIAKWTWTSIPTLNSRNWKGMNQTKKFEPIIKQLQKYSAENVIDFFGKKEYAKLENLQRILSASDGRDHKPEEYAKAFDDIYAIVYSVLKTKK